MLRKYAQTSRNAVPHCILISVNVYKTSVFRFILYVNIPHTPWQVHYNTKLFCTRHIKLTVLVRKTTIQYNDRFQRIILYKWNMLLTVAEILWTDWYVPTQLKHFIDLIIFRNSYPYPILVRWYHGKNLKATWPLVFRNIGAVLYRNHNFKIKRPHYGLIFIEGKP